MGTELGLVSADQLPVAAEPVSTASALMQVIANAATNPLYDLDRMDRLFAMHRTMEARGEERLFDAAMADAQAEMVGVAADAENLQTKSKYATYYALDKAVRQVYTRHGFALSFSAGETPIPDWVTVKCHVAHKGGHARDYALPMPADGKGAKGGDVMTRTHATGSAASYGMRYLLKMIFNLAVGGPGEDDDGNKAGGEFITETQIAEIDALLLKYRVIKGKFLTVIEASDLDMIPAKKFREAIQIIEDSARAAREKTQKS